MDEKFVDDLVERPCFICGKKYLADGGDTSCGDVVCQAIFERDMDLAAVLAEAEQVLDAAFFDWYAESMGV